MLPEQAAYTVGLLSATQLTRRVPLHRRRTRRRRRSLRRRQQAQHRSCRRLRAWPGGDGGEARGYTGNLLHCISRR